MITLGGQILLSDSSDRAVVRPGVVEIRDEQIVGVNFGPIPASVDIGDAKTLICPGLIDTHLHLPQFDSIGAAGMKLLPWLANVVFPAEQRWNDLDFAQSMIQRVAGQCLAVGTTGVCAYATVSHQSSMAALQAFDRIGFRGLIGQVMMDQDAPPQLSRPAEQLLDEVARTLDHFPPAGRMAAAVTPRFALACSPDLLQGAGELAEHFGATVQTHLAETVDECREVQKRFGGKGYVDVYDDAGLIGHRSILGHGIYLDPSSQGRLAEARAVIAHCPTANSFLASGTMNRYSHRRQGIPISLGSDIGAGFERSMVRVGRAMIEAAIRIAADQGGAIDDPLRVPSAAEAWHAITAGNAETLGWQDAGRIRAGGVADVLVIQPDIPWLDSLQPLSTLMFAWDDRWIRHTLLRGQILYSSGPTTGSSPR